MPTLDELLNTSNEVATCTVNPDTREIIVPEKYKILGVFSDEKVTRIPFTCPKVVGNNVDLTEYKLYINYQNAIGRHNAYLIDDIAVSGDNITFSWLLSRDVTLSSGVVKYNLCAKKLNGDSISNEWNTTIANGVVIQGLEATQAIVEENSDIIEAILSKAHTHANKSVLDKFAEADGKPTYDGKALGGSPNAVLYTAQTITDAQKKQARDNIDAASNDFVINGTLNDEALTSDKTYAQIQEAVQAGKSAVLKVKVYGIDFVLPLTGKSSSGYMFTTAATIFPTVTIKFTAVVGASETAWHTERVITCDSDGKIEQFSMDRDPSQPMEVATKQYVDDHAGGGTDMGITGASVGQIAKITAVDESGVPTAWSPADMPSGGSSDFVIIGSLTEAGGITLDKTFAQIQEAVQAGKNALIRVDGGPTTIILPLAVKNSEISTEYDFSIGYFVEGRLNGVTVRVMESGPVLYTASTPTNNLDGTMPQVNMAASPTEAMEIATKQYVDNALDGKAGTAAATQSAAGLMSAADKAKLDGIERGANKTTIPTALKNPNALTIKIGSTTVTYDGSTAQTVTIADGSEVAY